MRFRYGEDKRRRTFLRIINKNNYPVNPTPNYVLLMYERLHRLICAFKELCKNEQGRMRVGNCSQGSDKV